MNLYFHNTRIIQRTLNISFTAFLVALLLTGSRRKSLVFGLLMVMMLLFSKILSKEFLCWRCRAWGLSFWLLPTLNTICDRNLQENQILHFNFANLHISFSAIASFPGIQTIGGSCGNEIVGLARVEFHGVRHWRECAETDGENSESSKFWRICPIFWIDIYYLDAVGSLQ